MPPGYSKSWLQFLQEVESAKNAIGFSANGTNECFYRGQANTNYQLAPGLFRTKKKMTNEVLSYLWQTESDLFYEFRAKAKELHNQNLSDWDLLFFMQHHGVKTRLLDWSESLGVAIYFSLLGCEPEKRPCVWIMNPYKLNKVYHKSEDLYDPVLLDYYKSYNKKGEPYSWLLLYDWYKKNLPWDKPVALYPVRRADRLTTQSGYFTIHGNDPRPLNEIVPESKKIWMKIDIPQDAIPSAYKFLEHTGINEFSLFPDMDGLAKYLNKKYSK